MAFRSVLCLCRRLPLAYAPATRFHIEQNLICSDLDWFRARYGRNPRRSFFTPLGSSRKRSHSFSVRICERRESNRHYDAQWLWRFCESDPVIADPVGGLAKNLEERDSFYHFACISCPCQRSGFRHPVCRHFSRDVGLDDSESFASSPSLGLVLDHRCCRGWSF